MKQTIALLVTFAVLSLFQSIGQDRPEVLDLRQSPEDPAQSLPEALALVELYSSSERAWLNQGADYVIHSPDFERVFAVYDDGHCLQQMAGWEAFQVDTELDEQSWFIGYQHSSLDKKVVFRLMRDGRVMVLMPQNALLIGQMANPVLFLIAERGRS